MRDFGQYSLVSYIHELRGERINLGVLVWHPWLGHDVRFIKSLQRIRCIDESADLERVRIGMQQITNTMNTWMEEEKSPLAALASEFRHGLIVTPPMNARI